MEIQISKNLKKIPPYLFVELDKAKRAAIGQGRDIIDLGIGDPDVPTPEHIINELCVAVRNPANHRYALDQGMPQLRIAIAEWYGKRFGVTLDPQTQIQPLIGSKEGIAHLPFAFLDRGDHCLVPDPCYPPYRNCTLLAGGKPFSLPLLEKNDFLPDLAKVPAAVARKTKILFVNYPNNPTAAVAPVSFLKDVLKFARKYSIIVASDLAYSEIAFDGYRPMSMLSLAKKEDAVVEFHSLSKTYNMTGWRIGWACGSRSIVSALAKFKTNIDSGIFQAVQIAGICALKTSGDFIRSTQEMYQERRDVIVDGLRRIGFDAPRPKATFYVWTKTPGGMGSIEFCKLVLDKADIVVTPGNGFGACGEGYFRVALTVDKARLQTAVERFQKLGI